MVLAHRVTYQGFKARAVKYRRTDGLSPETGSVDLAIADLAGLKFTMPDIPWRNAKGGALEIPGQLGIDQAWRLYSGEMSGHQTVTTNEGKKEKNLNLAGTLVLETLDGGSSIGKIAYQEVYVAFEGIEEITERLASAKKHNEGFIRVVLSDPRQFYTDYGLLFQSINCRLRSGAYDPRTVQKGGTPWPLEKVIPFLFGQLPGSPTVHPSSDVFKMSGNPPSDIIGEGEPIGGILQDLLNQYGLIAKFLPDGSSYLVVKKWEGKAKSGRIARSPGNSSTWEFLKTEKKSVSGVNRPPLVCVKGRRRVGRVTVPYVPVVQWTDGKFYQLDDIGSLIPGYSISDVNAQTLNNESKNFQDVIGKAASGSVGYSWMQILRKWAYKGYAPASAFKEGPNPSLVSTPQGFTPSLPGGGAQKKTLHVIEDEDFEFIPFLPAVDAPWYKGDTALAGLDMMFKGIGSKKSEKGDQDGIVLLPPVVKSRTIGELWFQDAGEIAKHLKKVADSYGKEKEYADARVKICEDRGTAIINHINSTNRNAANIARMNGISSNPLPVLEIDQETRNAGKGFGVFDSDVKKVLDDFGLGNVRAALDATKLELAEWKDQAKDADARLRKALKDITVYQSVYATYRGFAGIGNLPVKIAERGKYSFDNRSGIILFSEPQCVGSSTLVMADEFQSVVADGAVSVSFGYELRFNGVQDWTTIYIAPEPQGKGQSAKAAVVGYSRPSGVKARIERAPDLTLYMDEYGNPMNLTQITDAAVRKAQFQVSLPSSIEGFQSIYHGFVPCVLDSGINCVQHSWDGGKTAAYTHVYQNYPGGAGPLGPAMTPSLGAAEGRARARAALEELRER